MRIAKKRHLGITPKTALFCSGLERTLHGEAAAEEIGVRPNLVLANDSNFDRNPLRGCNYGSEGGAVPDLGGATTALGGALLYPWGQQ